MSQLESSTRTSLSAEMPPNYYLDLIDSSNEPNDESIFSDDDICTVFFGLDFIVKMAFFVFKHFFS